MKTKIFFLGIALLSLSSLLNAQINGKAKITVDELIIQKTKMFDELVAKDFSSISEPGHPKLPVKIETFVVPYDAEVTGISINSLQKEKMDGKYYVYPAQPPRPLDWSEPPEFVEPDPEIYNSTSPYPEKNGGNSLGWIQPRASCRHSSNLPCGIYSQRQGSLSAGY